MRALAFCLFALSTLTAGQVVAAEPSVSLDYAGKHLTLTAADLAKLPVHDVQATDHGVSHLYHGVAMHDVIGLVGLPDRGMFRGRMLGLAAVAQAADGYVVVFALAEFDDGFRDSPILLVESVDGKPLGDHDGPFRLVCPGDKHPARWIRQLRSIKIVSLAPEGTRYNH